MPRISPVVCPTRKEGEMVRPYKKKPIEERFWVKVEMIPFHSCWEWSACTLDFGHGQFNVGNKKRILAHVYSYILHKGPVPEGLQVNHTCDNPGCVNPDHLYSGTQQDNMDDIRERKRSGHLKKTHCPQGHEYSPDNLLKRDDGYRDCKICARRRNSECQKKRLARRKNV